jgi:O-antigen/teichoic acid export membrane protein
MGGRLEPAFGTASGAGTGGQALTVESAPTALAGLAALIFIALVAWRPLIGAGAMVLGTPLTAGLGRGTVVPMLRVSEAITLLVVAGVTLHLIPRRRQRALSGLDVMVVAFVVGSVLIPALVLFVGQTSIEVERWRTLLVPATYLVFYLIFSRLDLSESKVRLLLNLAMATSVVVGVVAIAQLADVPGVRELVRTFFLEPPGQETGSVYRPTSFLEHYSSVGAYALLNYSLALALAVVRHPGFSSRWLGAVMAINLVALLASQTYAPVLGLVAATTLIVWFGRRVPRQLSLSAVVLLVGVVFFASQVGARLQEQNFDTANPTTPDSVQVRVGYWQEIFLPVLAEHIWLGTGTILPSEVPEQLTNYTDNEYLSQAFRAGVMGLALLLGIYLVIGVVGWRTRAAPNPSLRAIGATAVAYAAVVALMGTTAEYLTFAGVGQQFWMVMGMLSALRYAAAAPSPARVVILKPPAPIGLQGARLPGVTTAMAAVQRLAPAGGLIHSSSLVFLGTTSARFLGFLFSVAAARFLLPANYGLLAYGIAIVGLAAILIQNAPNGMARFLALHQGNRAEQDVHLTNWLAVIAIMVALSLVLAIPGALLAGLRGWMLVGILSNLLGLAVLETYRAAQRATAHYAALTSFVVVANFAQLAGIVVAAVMGHRNAALFFNIYGLSSVVALFIMLPLAPLPASFVRRALDRGRVKAAALFFRPLLLQTAFFAVWAGADLILVQRLMSATAAGNYAVARTLASVLALAPSAISNALFARVAQLSGRRLRAYVLGVLGLTAAVTVPLFIVLAIFGKLLITFMFGSKYPFAAESLTLLGGGMALYGFYLVLETAWVALGHPEIDALATGTAMVTTVAAGFLLIPRLGLTGAALASGAGVLAMLAVIGTFTVREWYGGRAVPEGEHHARAG